MKLSVQLHSTLSLFVVGAIVNSFPFNSHVAFQLFVTLTVIVSQSHALTHKSSITLFILLFPVITHNSLLAVVTVNSTSCHVNVAFCTVVALSNASLTITGTVCVHVVFLYKLYVVLDQYVHDQLYGALVCNHTHASTALLITAVHVLHSYRLLGLVNVYVGAVRSILFTTSLPLYASFPFPSTALKHTYVPLSLSVLNTISLHDVYGIVALSHVSLVHVL